MIDITQNEYVFNGVKIHQPTIFELAEIFKEEENLILCLKILIFPIKDMFKSEKVLDVTEFKLLLGILASDISQTGVVPEKKKMLLKFINLLFNNMKMTIVKESFVFEKDKQVVILDDSNFEEFKMKVKQMYNIPELFGDEEAPKYNPKNERAARIAAMLEKGNAKVAAENSSKAKKGVIENYLTILSIGLQIPPARLSKELTLYNLFNLHKRFIAKVGWDLDIKCRLAGGSPKETPENWINLF
jgi:hypothetical protein